MITLILLAAYALDWDRRSTGSRSTSPLTDPSASSSSSSSPATSRHDQHGLHLRRHGPSGGSTCRPPRWPSGCSSAAWWRRSSPGSPRGCCCTPWAACSTSSPRRGADPGVRRLERRRSGLVVVARPQRPSLRRAAGHAAHPGLRDGRPRRRPPGDQASRRPAPAVADRGGRGDDADHLLRPHALRAIEPGGRPPRPLPPHRGRRACRSRSAGASSSGRARWNGSWRRREPGTAPPVLAAPDRHAAAVGTGARIANSERPADGDRSHGIQRAQFPSGAPTPSTATAAGWAVDARCGCRRVLGPQRPVPRRGPPAGREGRSPRSRRPACRPSRDRRAVPLARARALVGADAQAAAGDLAAPMRRAVLGGEVAADLHEGELGKMSILPRSEPRRPPSPVIAPTMAPGWTPSLLPDLDAVAHPGHPGVTAAALGGAAGVPGREALVEGGGEERAVVVHPLLVAHARAVLVAAAGAVVAHGQGHEGGGDLGEVEPGLLDVGGDGVAVHLETAGVVPHGHLAEDLLGPVPGDVRRRRAA